MTSRRGAQWLDLGLLLGALAVIGVLVGWWNVFSRRLIEENRALQVSHADVPVAQAAERAGRLELMIVGESFVLASMLAALVVGLWLVARERQRRTLQMARLLQFTGHEFKTPVAGLKALLEALKAGRVPLESQPRLLDHGLHACDALEHLTDSMLVLQRSRAVDPKALAHEDAMSLVLNIVDHRRVAHVGEEVRVGDLESCLVRADRDAVRVVLENLFDNARKYGGAKTTVSSATEGQRLRISIADSGRGFAPADAERLFEVDQPSSNDGVTHGSGLGLHLSRQLARAMGGDLVAESEGPGKGAAFHLWLTRVPEVRS
ncbi:MAG: HAMP domain-containing histidine kinase [Myxococcus sp.]|nr:HAMP domain-containing histidine kinase [Myxococcus sp.]